MCLILLRRDAPSFGGWAKKAKSIKDRLSRAVEVGDSVAIDLAKGDLEREASERYKGFVVRNRLKEFRTKP